MSVTKENNRHYINVLISGAMLFVDISFVIMLGLLEKEVVMKRILSFLVIGIILILSSIQTASSKEVLPEYPILKVYEYSWAAGEDYDTKNTTENKTSISQNFLKVLNEEERAVDEFLNSKTTQKNKDKAFLKHMNNVQAVATHLAQVVDWIIYDNNELEEQGYSHTLNKTIYGIEYQFHEKMVNDEGEYFYSYGGYGNDPRIVDYPMITLKNDYIPGGTEIHTQGKRVDSFYIDKYKDKVSQEAINMLSNGSDLSSLDYEAEKNVMDYVIDILPILAVVALAIAGFLCIPKDKMSEFIRSLIAKSQKIQEEYSRTHCRYCGAKFVNDSSQFCSKCGKSRE